MVIEHPPTPATRVPVVQSPLRVSTLASQVVPESQAGYFSPLDGAGFYVVDRVIKSGQVLKRKRRTKTWASIQLVLRPNVLSIYKDSDQTQLRHQIRLSELTAVAARRDRKGRESHNGLFDLYTPSRNFHLDAPSIAEAKEWVDLIKQEAKFADELEDTTTPGLASSSTGRPRTAPSSSLTSVPTPSIRIPRRTSTSSTRARFRSMSIELPSQLNEAPRISESYDQSATDPGSFSDFSDEPAFGSVGELPVHIRNRSPSALSSSASTSGQEHIPDKPFYQLEAMSEDEKVICSGWLRYLRTRGVKQWKKYWVVLRRKSLALYRGEEEYRALLLLPLSTIVDAVETDALSSRRQYCMQVIGEDSTYRFAAEDENDLERWLGGLKSVIAKKTTVSNTK